MDSSIRLQRLDDIFGSQDKIKLSELSPRQASAFALEILAACKGHLTYLAGFERIFDYMFETIADDNGSAVRTRDHKSKGYPLPHGYTSDLLCVLVRTTIFERWGVSLKRRARRQGFVYRQQLLLSRDGSILVWDWFARCERNSGRREEIFVRSKVRLAGGRALRKILSKPENALALVTRLGWLVTDTLEERRRRLAAMEGLDSFIKAGEARLLPG